MYKVLTLVYSQSTDESEYSDVNSTGYAKFFETLPKTYKFDCPVGPGIIDKHEPGMNDRVFKCWYLDAEVNISKVFFQERGRIEAKAEAKETLTIKEQMMLNFNFSINPDEVKPDFVTHIEWFQILSELSAGLPTVSLSYELNVYKRLL